MAINQIIYAACGIAFLGLIVLMLLRARVSGPGIAVIVACALTALWAGNLAAPGFLPTGAGPVLDSLRLSAWLTFMVTLIGLRSQRRQAAVLSPVLLAVGFCTLVVGYEIAALVNAAIAGATSRVHDVLRVGLGVAGLLAAENLLRNADDGRRRDLRPLCLALGVVFAFELSLFADRLIVPRLTPMLAGGRGIVSLAAVPLLALAMARNREWRIDIHVSRTVVLHTAALVASGLFFIVLAAVGALVRELGGNWGPPLQVLTFLGSAIVLVSVLGSRDIRIQLKQVIARHFFSHRYDYREEWLRFVDTVSQPGAVEESLPTRVVQALAQIVDSPAGSLWRLEEEHGYAPEVGWNLTIEHNRKLPLDDPFVAGFEGGNRIQESRTTAAFGWPFDPARAWIAIPLVHRDAVVAFVILASSRHSYRLDWESRDLLRAAARQAASYLAEEQSTRALLDAKVLTDYSKRFAFVVHDVKNVANQLGLVVSNARRWIENPEFREDMRHSLEDSVERMNRLIARLTLRDHEDLAQLIEPDTIIAGVAHELSSVGTPIETRLGAPACRVAVGSDQLRSILSHLINNAREAAQSASAVVVASHSTPDKITIDVVDTGPGMDGEFIRNELFRPFRSTKSRGMGIGAYQTRELLRMAGGELEVISAKGRGTTMRITFPLHSVSEPATSAA